MTAPDDSSAPPAADLPDDMQTIAVAKPVAAPLPEVAVMGANPDSSVPFVFGKQIAKGGMGAILEGEDCKLGRTIAVKVMLDPHASSDQARRFVQEAAVLGRLEHPNIVPIHDLGRDSEGALYYTMKLVKGRTLQQIIDDLRKEKKEVLEHYTLDRLLTIFRKVCDALAFAHASNIIHRDLKPENVMVGEFGEVLVMDWGIAKVLNELGVEGSADTLVRSVPDPNSGQECPRSSTASFTATLDGAVMGTPNYMSPEQAMGKVNELDECSDIFSLGGILYAILTLRPPVEGKDVWEVLEKVQMANITDPTKFGATTGQGTAKAKGDLLEAKKITPLPHMPGGRVPNALSAVAMKALTLDKTKRYQQVAAFSADIEKYQGGFATSAENAGALTQLKLLILRHKAVTTALAAMLILSIGFVLKVMASESKATQNAEKATKNEQRANQHAEESRRSLARAQIAVADAAAANQDGAGLRLALDACPDDLRDSTWRYLEAQLDGSAARLKDPGIKTYGCVFRRTGSGAEEGEFLLADVGRPMIYAVRPQTGEVIRRMQTHAHGRKTLYLRSDGAELLVVGEGANGYEILDAQSGASRLYREYPKGTSIPNGCLSAKGDRIVLKTLEGSKGMLRCLDRVTGALVWEKPGRSFWPSADGQWLAVSNSIDETILLRADTGEQVLTLESGNGFLWNIAFSPDGRLLACGDQLGYATVWDRATGRLRHSFRVSSGRVMTVDFLSDDVLVTYALETSGLMAQRHLRFWNISRTVPLEAMMGVSNQGGHMAVVGASGRWVCTDGEVPQFWRTNTRRHRQEVKSVSMPIQLGFLGDSYLLVGTGDRAVELFRRSQGGFVRENAPVPVGMNVTVSGDHARALMGRNVQKVLELAEGRLVARHGVGPLLNIDDFILNHAGDHVLSIGKYGHGSLMLHRMEGGGLVRAYAKVNVRHSRLPAFADGERMVLAVTGRPLEHSREEGLIVCFDRESGRHLRTHAHPSYIAALAVSPGGRRIAFGGVDKSVSIVEAVDFKPVTSFRAHDLAVRGIAWHPTRPLLATVSDDISLKLWDLTTGKMLSKSLGQSRSMVSVTFDASGSTLAVGTADKTVLFFDTESLMRQ